MGPESAKSCAGQTLVHDPPLPGEALMAAWTKDEFEKIAAGDWIAPAPANAPDEAQHGAIDVRAGGSIPLTNRTLLNRCGRKNAEAQTWT